MSQPSNQTQSPLNVQDLEPDQLKSVNEQLEQEIVHFTTLFTQLRSAIAKYSTGIEAIDELKSDSTSKDEDDKVLVPLTASLYVPGKLKDRSRVMVDVGTGYMIDQPVQSARKCLNQKVLSLSVQLDQLQGVIETKQENAALVKELIRN
ncbi:Prefoldin subunit-domain-containing protein [Melampsora americana]|nr:Prefoldin subunit-domain-containing protein [Melampsora americana]